jgi:hypothetical protein
MRDDDSILYEKSNQIKSTILQICFYVCLPVVDNQHPTFTSNSKVIMAPGVQRRFIFLGLDALWIEQTDRYGTGDVRGPKNQV